MSPVDQVATLVEDLRSETIRNQKSLLDTVRAIKPIVDEIRGLIGLEIAESLNRFVGQKIGDLGDKRETTKQISDLLDELGLRVICPKTGRGAALLANTCSDNNPEGAFLLKVNTHPKSTTQYRTLPKIELTFRDMTTKAHRYQAKGDGWDR